MKIATYATLNLDRTFEIWREFIPSDWEVYRHADPLHYPHYYVHQILKHWTDDWLIFIDPDCHLIHPHVIDDIRERMVKRGLHIAGVPDGGVIPTRWHNPNYPNPFFLIINFAPFRELYRNDPPIMDWTTWLQVRDEARGGGLIDHKLVKPGYAWSFCVCEGLYSLFYWFRKHGARYLWLDSREQDLGVYPTYTFPQVPWGGDFAVHSWYARDNHLLRIETMASYVRHIRNPFA